MNFKQINFAPHRRQTDRQWVVTLIILCGLIFASLWGTTTLRAQDQATPTPAATAFTYIVVRGDTWLGLAERFAIPVRDLRAANPEEASYYPILRLGKTLNIPGSADPTPSPTDTPAPTVTPQPTATPPRTDATASASGYQEYVVQPGDYWSGIAEQFGVSMRELMAANPRSIRYNYILYRGERLLIPVPAADAPLSMSEAARAVTVTPTTPATATPPPVTATVIATVTVTATTAITATTPVTTVETITTTAAVTTAETVTATTSVASGCPNDFAAYPESLLTILNEDGLESLIDFLQVCKATVEAGLQASDWTGDDADDLVLIYLNPASGAVRQTELIIFNSQETGFAEGYRAKAAGEVTLLATADINGDNQPDIAWADRNCGASTCFDTVEVVSWDGSQWRDWTTDVITMAYAEVELADATDEGQGEEIILTGGVYGSVGAGPQRSRTETWASLGGAPYSLAERIYSDSKCAYHAVLDANEALLRGDQDNFAEAETLYTKSATDQSLEKCWVRDNELDELRSFSLFRLALTAAYQGKPSVAADVIGSLSASYEGSIYNQLGQAWLSAYQESNDIGAACSAANQFATDHAEAWEILADYGYANPTFSAGEVCPVLDVETPAATEGVESTAPVTSTAPITDTDAPPSAQLPACPVDLSGYGTVLPEVLTSTAGDAQIIETWLRQCDAMSDDRGGFTLVDANGDGVQDALFWPTVVSDLGFGPDGTQGDLLIYHGNAEGGYDLIDDEEIYGQPTLLAAEDLNGDDRLDLAWQVIGCSTFCVLEAQIVSWDGEGYGSIIQPGATIAEGTATFEPVTAGDPGAGKQLVLQGGVSGTAEGGLAVPHAEIWQSINGAAFQRIRWTYDRTVEGNDCLGLRLIEGDVALDASSVLGYQPAIDIFTQSIDPALKACSIFGMKADEELMLLQGLTSFRLIEAQALSGDLAGARATLEAFSKGQPDSDYTQAATQWLDTYERGQNTEAACQAVLPIFVDDPTLWQITDHFGYNHPALAAEQICYAP